MVFTIPEGLHPDLNPLAWLVGTWGGKGRGDYPDTESFEYEQEIVFSHDGRPFLTYFSRSWIIDTDGNRTSVGPSETGFWSVRPNNVLEVMISHSEGTTAGWLGRFDGPKIQLVLDRGYVAPSAHEIGAGERLYGLVHGELFTSTDISRDGFPIQAYTWATLPRVE